MFSSSNPRPTTAQLPTNRLAITAVIAALAIVAIASIAAAPIAAQEQATNETEPDQVIYEFEESTVELVSVEFDDDTAYITLRSDEPETVTVSDAGFSGHGSFDVQTHTIRDEKTVQLRLKGKKEIGVATPQDGFRYKGDQDVLTVIASAPTASLVAWGVISGVDGSILALGLAVAWIRRGHENTYRELTSKEAIAVESEPVEGWVDRVKSFVLKNVYFLAFGGLTLMYLALWMLGVAPGPGEIWGGLTDGMRVVVIGSIVATLAAFLPVYALASRLWEPRKEFVVSLDARDVMDEALGSEGGLGELIEAEIDADRDDQDDGNDRKSSVGISVYSGAPERIAEMDVDGAAADSRAPGGPVHFVEKFNPRENQARGTWPGTADDVEIIAERSKIDGNREILRDESAMLRSILSALPAIQTSADTGAMRAADKELRKTLAIDGSPVDGILSRASRGTRFAGFYDDQDDDQDGESLEYEEENDDEITNEKQTDD